MSTHPLRGHALTILVTSAIALSAACKDSGSSAPAQPDPTPTATASANVRRVPPAMARPLADGAGLGGRRRPPIVGRPANSVTPAADDPLKGKWTMAEAIAGVTGKGALLATIETDKGNLVCNLFEDRAPISVANFVGLARGLRPWKTPEGKWVKKPAYDGTTFHRIVRGFMIQGGDPTGTGQGMPGYSIPDEVWEGAYHDRAGLLCMANMGPDTNGAQFFITDGPAAHLDNRYTILGECSPTDLVRTIASGDVQGDRAKTPVVMKKVTVSRGVAPASGASASASASAAPSASVAAPSAPQ